MSMFHVGQRVACIAAPAVHLERMIPSFVARPAVGCVYTIRDVVRGTRNGRPVPGLIFHEIINPIHAATGVEYNFDPRRFRPVKDTSIEVFRKLLAPMPEKADA